MMYILTLPPLSLCLSNNVWQPTLSPLGTPYLSCKGDCKRPAGAVLSNPDLGWDSQLVSPGCTPKHSLLSFYNNAFGLFSSLFSGLTIFFSNTLLSQMIFQDINIEPGSEPWDMTLTFFPWFLQRKQALLCHYIFLHLLPSSINQAKIQESKENTENLLPWILSTQLALWFLESFCLLYVEYHRSLPAHPRAEMENNNNNNKNLTHLPKLWLTLEEPLFTVLLCRSFKGYCYFCIQIN